MAESYFIYENSIITQLLIKIIKLYEILENRLVLNYALSVPTGKFLYSDLKREISTNFNHQKRRRKDYHYLSCNDFLGFDNISILMEFWTLTETSAYTSSFVKSGHPISDKCPKWKELHNNKSLFFLCTISIYTSGCRYMPCNPISNLKVTFCIITLIKISLALHWLHSKKV